MNKGDNLIKKQLELGKQTNVQRSKEVDLLHNTPKYFQTKKGEKSKSDTDQPTVLSDKKKTITKKNELEKKFMIKKLICIKKQKPQKCSHSGNIIMDRDILKSQEHIKLLATPKKVEFPLKYKFVDRELYPATNRVTELACPKRNYVLNNFKFNLPNLRVFQVENFLQTLNGTEYQSPQQVLNVREHQIRDDEIKKRHQKKKISKMQKKVKKEKLKVVQDLMDQLFKRYRDFCLNGQKMELHGEMTIISEIVLLQLSNLMNQKFPRRDSSDILEQFFCELADKIAFWITSLVEQCQYKSISRDDNDVVISKLLRDIIESAYRESEPEELLKKIELGVTEASDKKVDGTEPEGTALDETTAETELEDEKTEEERLLEEALAKEALAFEVDPNECRELLKSLNLLVEEDDGKKLAVKPSLIDQLDEETRKMLLEKQRQKLLAKRLEKLRKKKAKKGGPKDPDAMKGKWEIDFYKAGKNCS